MITSAASFLAATVLMYADVSDLINFSPGKETPTKQKSSEVGKKATSQNAVASVSDSIFELTDSIVLKALEEQLVKNYQLKGDLSLSPLQPWKTMILPSSSWKLEMTQYPSGGLETRFHARFKIHSEGRLIGEWTWLLRAELWQEAFITRKQMNAGTSVNIADLTMRKVDALSLRDTLVPSTTVLNGYATKHTVSANKPLFLNDLESRAIVQKGAMTKVIAKQGTLEITLTARAMEDGALGDVVTLRNIDSNKRIQGEVIDENTVRVYF